MFAMPSSSGGKFDLKMPKNTQKSQNLKACHFLKNYFTNFFVTYFRHQNVCVVKISGGFDHFPQS